MRISAIFPFSIRCRSIVKLQSLISSSLIGYNILVILNWPDRNMFQISLTIIAYTNEPRRMFSKGYKKLLYIYQLVYWILLRRNIE